MNFGVMQLPYTLIAASLAVMSFKARDKYFVDIEINKNPNVSVHWGLFFDLFINLIFVT